MKVRASSRTGEKLKIEWLIELSKWKRPLGPAGFMAWSVTLPISGNSRLANHKMLSALLVQEICSAIHALLLLTSVQPSTSASIVSLKNLRAKSTARAVSSESMTTVFPSAATSAPPYDQSNGYSQPWLSPKPCPSSKPKGWSLAFNFLPTSYSSSQVSGNFLTPTSANQSVRQFISWPILLNGIAFHLPFSSTASLPASYQPPWALPTSSAMSPTSRYFSPNWITWSRPFIVISAPEPVSAMVLIRVGRLPTLVTS